MGFNSTGLIKQMALSPSAVVYQPKPSASNENEESNMHGGV
jgi:hypothetical protein